MCILLVVPSYGSVKKIHLQRSFSKNRDGAGFSYSHNNELFTEKGFFSFDSFYERYKRIPKNSPRIIHFRRASHGAINAENCHPFLIDENHALAHNGIISELSDNKLISDTKRFVEEIMHPMFDFNNLLWQQKFARKLIEKYIGACNKVAIISNTGEIIIYRSEYGRWEDNHSFWASNDDWKTDLISQIGNGVSRFFVGSTYKIPLDENLKKNGLDFSIKTLNELDQQIVVANQTNNLVDSGADI